MAKNEKTSTPIAKIASKVLRTGHATQNEAKRLAGSALTQRPDKKKK
jgi:hypothetical protein